MAHYSYPDGPAEYHPGKDAPHNLGLGRLETAGKLRAVAEREHDAERQRRESRDQREPIELVEALERRKELKHLAKASGLELAEL